MIEKVFDGLRRFAEGVAALLLAVIFLAFIAQIVLRYVFNWPVGWTADLSSLAWLWLVLWGAAFVLRDEEEIRFDVFTSGLRRRGKIVVGAVASIAMIVLFAMALPAAYSYVSFMKVEKSSYLNIRFDFLYSIYLVFSVAVIVRHLYKLVSCLRGQDPSGSESSFNPSSL